jgi:quercetin dioxygenase-like cupin family protein
VSNIVDFESLPVIDVWGTTIRARRVQGERITMAMVELAPDDLVPNHQHEAEQLGFVIRGALRFTVGDEVRDLGPGGTWRIPSGVPHEAHVGPDGATVIDVFSPPRHDWDVLPVSPPEPAARWPARP